MNVVRRNKAKANLCDLTNGQVFRYIGVYDFCSDFYLKIEPCTKDGKPVNAICLNDNRLVLCVGEYDVEIIKGYFQEED